MDKTEKVQVQLVPYKQQYDLDQIIFDLDQKLELLSSHGDQYDYLIAIASGILCGLLDVLWVGDFSLERGRDIASEQMDTVVQKTAKLLGYHGEDLQGAVSFLEKRFLIPSDGNTLDFGGGLQHHLRDFAHHPTLVGMAFSLLTQFTEKSFGTDVNGSFIVAPVPEKSRVFIGKDVPTKILYGTLIWFFHLVSDMAGSSSTADKSGGTGVPGPILALAKELSAIPIFKNMHIGDQKISVFLSKLFNGTLLAQHDEHGKIIKDTELRFDLRGELGVAIELERQSLPVAANECIVRGFYLLRHLAIEMQKKKVCSIAELKQISWTQIKPAGNPTIIRMLTIATGIFTTMDITAAAASQQYWVAVNYVGVGRFAVAIGDDIACGLQLRQAKQIKQMYEEIQRQIVAAKDRNTYERMQQDMNMEKLGLSADQLELLYNLEYYKTANDMEYTKGMLGTESTKRMKREWMSEWKSYMTKGFPEFLQEKEAELHWYSREEMLAMIETMEPEKTWFHLVLLEAMLFEPYFALSLEMDKKGNQVPSKKYKELQSVLSGYKRDAGDHFLEELFAQKSYYRHEEVKRYRKCYEKVQRELNEVLKTVLASVSVGAALLVATIATAGAFAPAIAVTLVGSQFAGLSGAALTGACLAYLGGGAIAVGGAGMAGGVMAIVGGGAVLGLGVGAGAAGAVSAVGLMKKKNTILQSAKLLVAVRAIFLNGEKDVEYSNSIYEQYVQNIVTIEQDLVQLKLTCEDAEGNRKKELKKQIKETEETVKAMKIAKRDLKKFRDAFQIGLEQATGSVEE